MKVIVQYVRPYPKTMLDLGCGEGVIGYLSLLLKEKMEKIVGVDIDIPSLRFCYEHKLYDRLVSHNVNKSLPFKDKEFDVVVSCELLEHLEKDKSMALLDEMERVGKWVVISTPTYFFQNAPELIKNEPMRHRCLWRPREFRQRGYTIRGTGGFQIFGHPMRYISYAFNGLTYLLPEISMSMVAWKKCV